MGPTLRAVVALATILALAPAQGRAAAALDRNAVEHSVCGGRAPCALTALRDAGQVGGDSLAVAEVSLAANPDPSARSAPNGECRASEHWLVVRNGAGKVSFRPLIHICNDGYGARGLGEDRIEVTPNRFTHTRVGGAAWMWSHTNVVQLAPLAIVAESAATWWTIGDARRNLSWSWTDWTGFASGRAPACVDPAPPPAKKQEIITYAHQPIPRAALDDDFRTIGWRTADFSACATRIDARGGATEKRPGGGFVIHGKPAERAEVAVQAVLSSQNELFIQVEDTNWVPTASSWVAADHLEIWVGERPDSSPSCVEPRGHLAQWGITLDGAVHPAFGSPAETLAVERAEKPGPGGARSLRFKVQLPASLASREDDRWRLTVAYSDSDGGKRQKRIIATSALKFGSLPTIGEIRDILPAFAACRRDGNRLRPIITRVLPDDKPVLE